MKKIIIHEVGIRDGLQAEKEVVPTEQKINWIKELAETGVDIIQAGSFVNPKKMPQMADTDELFKYFSLPENKLHNVTLSGLVLNEKRSEEHTSELQSLRHLVCRLLLEKKKKYYWEHRDPVGASVGWQCSAVISRH